MSEDDALLASALRKLIADPGGWVGGDETSLTVDCRAAVTADENAAVDRAYNAAHGVTE